MPIFAALGAFLLLGVLVLQLNGQRNGTAEQGNTSIATLQQARNALLVARSVLSSPAPDALELLSKARRSLAGLNVRGLSRRTVEGIAQFVDRT